MRQFSEYKSVVKVESSDNSIKLDLTYGKVGYRNAKWQQTNQIATLWKLQIMQIKGLRACARLAEHILEQRESLLSQLQTFLANLNSNVNKHIIKLEFSQT